MKSPRLILAITGGLFAIAFTLATLLAGDSLAQSDTRYITLLSSTGRTTTTNTADQVNIQQNLNARGVLVTLNVSAITATPRITPAIQVKDPASGNYENVLIASTGVTTTGTHSYLLYPGVGSASADITQVASFPLGHVWRVQVIHGDTDAITYTVGANLLP